MDKGSFVKNKVVLVTGAGGGIGRDFALALGAEGAKVIVNDLGTSMNGEGRDVARAQAVVDEIVAAGGQAVATVTVWPTGTVQTTWFDKQ